MASNAQHNTEETSAGAGAYAVAGYDYQVEVSIWLALDLVLANRLATAVMIEPASEEDLEADLESNEPGRITSTTQMGGCRLIVQAKRRTGDAWTVPALKSLLEHGKARPSAKQRLSDPHARYLLVTSAALNGGARAFRVRHPGVWPEAPSVPTLIESALPSGASGRIAIIANQDEERLATDVKALLTESFRVPIAQLPQCISTLRQEARVRLRGAGGGQWTREQLERIIKQHDGYIASSPELDRYVHPTHWKELRERMRDRSAALIVGQSGSGKTMATRKLFDELAAEIPGLARVPITRGPRQMLEDQTPGPVLYDIEDPWGRYDFEPTSRPWNDQLAQLFAQARHDRMIIATTRLDVAQSAGVMETVKPWVFKLEAEHYGPIERQRLYQRRIDALPRDLQALAKESEQTVLAELATPLEIQKFFDALPTIGGDLKKRSPTLVTESIRRAHQDSIERTVIDQIEERRDVRAAAVIWALLKATDKLSIRLLLQIEGPLADLDPQLERGVRPLVQFFVAARNLRQVEDVVTYYHPRVEAGIERSLLRDSLVVRRTLKRLVEVLLDTGFDQNWGAWVATRVLDAAGRIPELRPIISTDGQARIDRWLEGELQRGGKALAENLRLAASAGSTACALAEVARFLLHRPDMSFPGFGIWGAPKHDESWYVRMRADPSVKALVESFIRDHLLDSRDSFGEEFVTETARLAPNLTPAFLLAAERTVSCGYLSAGDVIAAGALADIAGFETIVDKAVQAVTPSAEELARIAEVRLDIDNEVYSDDYIEHVASDESGYMANEYLKVYVEHLRHSFNWQRIPAHRHAAALLPYWLRSLARGGLPSAEEVAAAFVEGFGHNQEDCLWVVATAVGASLFEKPLMRRVLDGHRLSDVRRAALACLARHRPAGVAEVVLSLTQSGQDWRIVEIAEELGQLQIEYGGRDNDTPPSGRARLRRDAETNRKALEMVYQELEPKVREICDLVRALESGKAPSLSITTTQWIADIQDPSEAVRWLRVQAGKHIAIHIPEDIRWILTESDAVERCIGAMEAAVRHNMRPEIEAGLFHRFANVVALALRDLAQPLPPPLPPSILELSKSRGSPIRRALAEVLKEKPHADHMPTLLRLAADNWSRDASYHDEDDDNPIAQMAVGAIANFDVIETEAANALYGIAVTTRDSSVRFSIFQQLARAAGAEFQTRLFDVAVTPGNAAVRQAAANALAICDQHVVPAVVERVTSDVIRTRMHAVATWLLILATLHGKTDQLVRVAEDLATHSSRRVFLLLMIWILTERDAELAQRVAGMLPAHHLGAQWALSGCAGEIGDATCDDLGDAISVEHVLKLMRLVDR